jgi:hypothetical protein
MSVRSWGVWVSVRARDRDGAGVAFGWRVVLRFGVSVGWDDRVADMIMIGCCCCCKCWLHCM